ncbi:MAG: alkaline phosphatase D family protein [Rhodospirillaceae bacterium]
MPHISKRTFLKYTGVTLVGSGLHTGKQAAAQSSTGKRRVMQGPMLGAVTPTSIMVWARVSDPLKVQVEYGDTPLLETSQISAAVTAKPEDDHTVRVVVTGLKPNTAYYYRLIIEGQPDDYQEDLPPFTFKTAPADGWRGAFRVGFGSCARIQEDATQPIWTVVNNAKPDLFLWLGDNIYADTRTLDIFQEEYRRQRLVPSLQPVLRNIPHLAIWDDHDFGLNDHDRTNPVKDIGLDAFKQYWANPSYGLPDTPGVFFSYSYGGIDFFMLDVRYYRDPNAEPDSASKTMLGTKQLEWLKAELKASRAPFKVLVSGSGWTKAKGPTGDAWSAFLTERNDLFAFIRDTAIDGVVLLSGDTHVAEANCIPFSDEGGYDLYDLTSSPLAQNPTDSWLERRPEIRLRNPVFESANVGLLDFDTSRDDPTLTYLVQDTQGRVPRWPVTVKASELRNGVTSWESKIDKLERARLESYRNGGPYYFPLSDE